MADDEVVFENSALYSHLKDVGFNESDFTIEQHTTISDGESLDVLQQDIVPPQDQRQEREDSLDITEQILRSGALEPEDADFVYNFSSCTSEVEDAINTSQQFTWKSRLCRIGILVTAYVTNKYFSNETSYPPCYISLWDAAAILILCGCISPRLMEIVALQRQKTKLKRRRSRIMSLVSSTREMKRLYKKCLRLIQEMELVARGFTLVGTKTLVSRLEEQSRSSTERQCMSLRQMLFNTSREIMLESRKTTRNVIQRYPLEVELGGSSEYLSNLPLEQCGSSVTTNDPLELSQVTDNYALSAIKAMVELCELHTSEFIRRITLALLLPSQEDRQEQTEKGTLNKVDSLRQKIEERYKKLRQCYILHQCTVLDAQEREVPATGKTSQVNNVYLAVHSLNLHTQAALKKIRSLEEELEPKSESEDREVAMTSDLQEKLSGDLKVIQTDLSACIDSWEEAMSRTVKSPAAAGRAKVGKTENDTDRSAMPECEPSRPIAIFDSEPIFDDQVFEAYTDPTELQTTDFDHDSILSLEEKNRKKMQKQEAKRVLNELKSVISIRDQMWQEREERARRRMASEDEQGEATIGAKITIQEQCEQLPVTKEDISGHSKIVEETATSEGSEVTNISPVQELCDGIQDGSNEPLHVRNEVNFKSKIEHDVPSKAHQDLVYEHDVAKYNEPQDDNVQAVNTLTADGKEGRPHYREKDDTMTSDINTNRAGNDSSSGLPNVEDLQVKFASTGLSFNFTKNVAAMAAAQSHNMTSLNVDTFGDSENSEEESDAELIQ